MDPQDHPHFFLLLILFTLLFVLLWLSFLIGFIFLCLLFCLAFLLIFFVALLLFILALRWIRGAVQSHTAQRDCACRSPGTLGTIASRKKIHWKNKPREEVAWIKNKNLNSKQATGRRRCLLRSWGRSWHVLEHIGVVCHTEFSLKLDVPSTSTMGIIFRPRPRWHTVSRHGKY